MPSLRVLGSEPGTGLARLQERVRHEMGAMSPGDEIWCVVDHDDRESGVATFQSRARRAGARPRPSRVHVAVSKPCFEYWLLLHFEFTTKPFEGIPGWSACSQVTRELKRHLPDYRKNDPALLGRIADRIPTAISNAKRVSDSGASSFTDLWKLIERLERLRTPGPT